MVDRKHIEEIPPEDFALFLAMREKIRQGNKVTFVYNERAKEMLAFEEVLHRAGDYRDSKAA